MRGRLVPVLIIMSSRYLKKSSICDHNKKKEALTLGAYFSLPYALGDAVDDVVDVGVVAGVVEDDDDGGDVVAAVDVAVVAGANAKIARIPRTNSSQV